MATIRKVPRKKSKSGYAYQVMIRRQGYGTISETFEKKADADKFARDHDREAKLAKAYGKSHNKTVADMLDKYMETYTGKDNSKPERLAWWKETIGDTKLRNLTPELIVECLDLLRAGQAVRGNGKGKTKSLKRKRSEPTVNRYHTALSSVLEVARTRWLWEVVSENPARRVARGKENKGIVRFLDDKEREALLKACKVSRWSQLYLLVILALSTGARLGELLDLRWSDIDLKKGLAFLGDTKNNERRALPLIPAVQTELSDQVRRIDSPFVFPSPFNNEEHHQGFREHWDEARAGIENFRFHDLRHSCASYLAMNGATELEIADVLGHKTLQMVKRYSHLSTDHKQSLVNRVLGDKV